MGFFATPAGRAGRYAPATRVLAKFLANGTPAPATYEQAVKGDVTPVSFTRGPVAGAQWGVRGLLFQLRVQNGGQLDPTGYGGFGALANGCLLDVHDGTSVVVDLLDGAPVLTNPEWMRIATWDRVFAFNGATDFLQAWIEFPGGIILDGDATEVLRITIQDDLSAGSFHGVASQSAQLVGEVLGA